MESEVVQVVQEVQVVQLVQVIQVVQAVQVVQVVQVIQVVQVVQGVSVLHGKYAVLIELLYRVDPLDKRNADLEHKYVMKEVYSNVFQEENWPKASLLSRNRVREAFK